VNKTMGLVLLALLVAAPVAGQGRPELAVQVRVAEQALADAMARRDLDAFAALVADEAVFFGAKDIQRGKAAVIAAWKPLFDGARAPFSWQPATVEVLESGTLAHSSGPVRNPEGRDTGTFNSIWRRDRDGQWRVVFDKGCSCVPGR
jgi:ketosteroid isomerase-like protein